METLAANLISGGAGYILAITHRYAISHKIASPSVDFLERAAFFFTEND